MPKSATPDPKKARNQPVPAISVIVPLYNTRDYIGECLQSLKNQTFEDFQVVCVNDGSTDDSLERAREAAAGDPRFKFVSRPNGGLSAARNTGLENATGTYVTFLDSDDRYRADALQMLHECAVRHNADLVDFSASTFYDTEEARRLHKEDYGFREDVPGVLSGPELFTRYVNARQFVASACFHLIRRSLFAHDDLRFVEGLLHEDEMFSPLLYAHAERALFLNEPLYERRMREGSIMTSPRTARNVNAVLRITQLHHAWLVSHVNEYDTEFTDAFAWNVALLRDAAFRAFRALPPDEAAAYVESLNPQDRADFNLHCHYAQLFAEERYENVASSRAFKLAQGLRKGITRAGR